MQDSPTVILSGFTQDEAWELEKAFRLVSIPPDMDVDMVVVTRKLLSSKVAALQPLIKSHLDQMHLGAGNRDEDVEVVPGKCP